MVLCVGYYDVLRVIANIGSATGKMITNKNNLYNIFMLYDLLLFNIVFFCYSLVHLPDRQKELYG